MEPGSGATLEPGSETLMLPDSLPELVLVCVTPTAFVPETLRVPQVEPLFECIRHMKIRRQQHESNIGLGRNDGKNQQLCLFGGANFLNEFSQSCFGGDAFLVGEHRPLAMLDAVEQMKDVPTLLGHDWGHGWLRHIRHHAVTRAAVKEAPRRQGHSLP